MRCHGLRQDLLAMALECGNVNMVMGGRGKVGGGGACFVYICSRGYSKERGTFISLVDWQFILL